MRPPRTAGRRRRALPLPLARIAAGAAAGLLLAAVWRGDGSVGFTGPRLRQRAVATALAAEVRSSPLLADLLAFAASESDEGKVAARVDGDFGGLAPEDLTSLQAQLATAPDEAARKPMEALTKGIQAAMEKRMQSATKDISELLSSSGDINQNIKDCLSRQDSPLPIMTVLQMNLAKAEKGSQQEKALSYIFNVMNQELQKKVPTVLKVLSTLLATPEAPVRRKVLKDHLAAMEAEGHRVEAAKDLSSAIVELVREAEVQFTGQNVETPQRVETLELIRRTAIDAGVVIAEVYGDEEQDMFTNELGPLFEALSRT